VTRANAEELWDALHGYAYLYGHPATTFGDVVAALRQDNIYQATLDALSEEIRTSGRLPALFRYDEQKGGQVIR
jgi:hypothetical protein